MKSSIECDLEDLEPAVAAWERKAQSEGLRCRACAMKIPFGNRDVYFRTGMCGHCAHEAQKS
ncbi:hypothetical protein SBBP1_120008 [Burkholderiales bacterium]|nr:hypothetical protein SBBP1_120008 [Burkholderiales bacterium]